MQPEMKNLLLPEVKWEFFANEGLIAGTHEPNHDPRGSKLRGLRCKLRV